MTLRTWCIDISLGRQQRCTESWYSKLCGSHQGCTSSTVRCTEGPPGVQEHRLENGNLKIPAMATGHKRQLQAVRRVDFRIWGIMRYPYRTSRLSLLLLWVQLQPTLTFQVISAQSLVGSFRNQRLWLPHYDWIRIANKRQYCRRIRLWL